MPKCVDCGNSLSSTAKTCGNPQCYSSDPFGKDRRSKKISKLLGVLVIILAVGFYIYQYGLTNPLDILRHPFQIR